MSTALNDSGQAASSQKTFPASLSQLSIDELLALSSRCFQQLDRKHPLRDAIVRYYAVALELESREATGS